MTSTATLHNTTLEYEVSPPYETRDYNNAPIKIDIVRVTRYAEGDDGKPYTSVETLGYALTKAGKRKGSHQRFYLGMGGEQALAQDVGIEVSTGDLTASRTPVDVDAIIEAAAVALETKHWIYVTNPITEVVHLTPFVNDGTTLCGKSVSVAWAFGDETLSGGEATCGTCRMAR